MQVDKVAEKCYLIIEPIGPVVLLFPVIRLFNNPVWYVRCSVDITNIAKQIYNKTVFSDDYSLRNGNCYAVSVSGKLTVNLDVRELFPVAIGPGAQFFHFRPDYMTFPQPIDLQTHLKFFLYVEVWIFLTGIIFMILMVLL